MKSILSIILLFAVIAFAQNNKKIYYKRSSLNNMQFIKSNLPTADYYAYEKYDAITHHTNKIFYVLKTGEKDFYGSYLQDTIPDGLFISYYDNGYVDDSGYYDKGVKRGNWFYYHHNGKLASEVKYAKDKGGFLKCMDENGNPCTCVPEVMASFPGGTEALSLFLARNIQIPDAARKSGTDGKVTVQFCVDVDGSIKDAQVIKDGMGNGCSKEALRVVALFPKWVPGKQFNRIVKSYYILPIGFRRSK